MTPQERKSSISAIALLDQMLTEIYDGHEDTEAVAREWLADIATNGHKSEIVTVLQAWRKYLEGALNED
jgi:hypothetical protein